MTMTRKFAYAAVLTLSAFALLPSLASAEDARGSFTLTHDVHCQKVLLHPGDYTFSVKSVGSSEFLTLRGTNGGTGAMLLVNNVESEAEGEGKLVLVSRDGESYVSSMALPELDMTLRFAVPSSGGKK